MMDVEAELAAVRRRAAARADRWVDDHARQQRLAGKADRAAMGNPDPSLAEVSGTIGKKVRDFVESVRSYLTP